MQHTPKGSLIKIEAKHAENSCEVIISDNGGGFPIDKMEAVFNKFYRLNNNIGGTGLGLSIVKGFTEAMNGTIHLQNKTNGGAKFTIKIPAETTTIEAYGNQ